MGTKNCPETPRQKMINMMYLVFVAMMALNVASEVLDAFKVVDSSLTQTLGTVDLKNQLIYNSFDKAYLLNQDKVKDWREKAMAVKKQTDTLTYKIQNIKEYLAVESGSENLSDPENAEMSIDDMPFLVNSRGDTVVITKQDDINTPSEIMIAKKKAKELKEAIGNYKAFLISQVPENSPIIETLNKALDTSDPKINLKEGGERKTWETTHFENKPLIAAIALLSKLQIDVKDAETNVITSLFGQIDASSFKFDKLNAYVLPKSSNYVLQGDVFEAQIFLGAEESTQQPEIYVNNTRLPVVDGKGVYKIQANTEGTFKFDGLIKYKTPEGSFNTYPFKGEYQVGRPSATISPTKMNVLYQSLANPVSISVPGVTAGIRATISNGRIEQRGGEFFAYPSDLDPNGVRTKIEVFAMVSGQERLMGSMSFRVKEVPPPIAEIGGKSQGTIRKEELLAEMGIFAEAKDFDFDLKYTVTQFNVSIQGTYAKDYPSSSNMFTEDQKREFRQLTPGSSFYINNIKAKGDNGIVKDLAPIVLKIR